MSDSRLGDMDAASFRAAGQQLLEWTAGYLENSDRYPVLSKVAPGWIRSSLPPAAPGQGESMEVILRDFERILLPGVTHWNHPGFLAYFASSGSGPGVLAEFLTAALNQQAMLWQTSPAATELEEVALGWLRQMLGLPEVFEGVVYDGGSTSNLHALAAALAAAVPDAAIHGLMAFALTPDYLRTDQHPEVRNLMDTGVALGRRFRALKLWMVLRYFGTDGIEARLADHIRLAKQLASWVDDDPDFERLAPVSLGVVCFRASPSGVAMDADALDRLNAGLLASVNESGEVYLSHTTLHGRLALRLAVGHIRTTESHVSRAWQLIRTSLASQPEV